MNAAQIVEMIGAFDEECQENERTNTGTAWVIFDAIRDSFTGLRSATYDEVNEARSIWTVGRGGVVIDTEPVISESRGGHWISAWLWIPDEEA